MSALRTFLTEENVNLHKRHLEDLRLSHSINEKSMPRIAGMLPSEVMRCGIPADVRSEVVANLLDIRAHELYFSSFCHSRKRVDAIRRYYSSEDAFLYDAFSLAKGENLGFLIFYTGPRGEPKFTVARDLSLLLRTPARLAVDLFEHAYFLDYGFDREKYLRAALEHLDIERLFE